MATAVKGLQEQTQGTFQGSVPIILGVAAQTPGNVVTSSYLVRFSIVGGNTTVTNYLINFNVIAGQATQYPVTFQVIAPQVVNHEVDFNIVTTAQYPISFTVVSTQINRALVSFTIFGYRYYKAQVAFTVQQMPQPYLISFNIQTQPVSQYPIIFYTTPARTNVPIYAIVTPRPSGSVVQLRNNLTFKVYLDGNLIGGNSAVINTPSGTGVHVDFLGIPPAGTAMLINTYNRGTLINTHSGSYQANIGVDVL